MDDELRCLVYSNLNNALDNGYDLRDWSPNEIAQDLLAFSADFEGYTGNMVDDLLPYIELWLNEPVEN